MSNPTEVAALITATNNLTQTVIDKRSEITTTVNSKIAQLDNWKDSLTAAKVSAEPRYVSTIDLTGLSTNRYYPVWWGAYSAKTGVQKITIARINADDADLDPFGSGNNQIASLVLEIEFLNFQGNFSNPAYFWVKCLSQLTRKTVRNVRQSMRCSSVLPADGQLTDNIWTQNKANPYRCGLYLRGGLSYRVIGNAQQTLEYSTVDTEVEILDSGALGTKGRWMVKSYHIDDPFLGPEYDNFIAPYNAFPYPV